MLFKDFPFLSNFHPCNITYNNVLFSSVENAYQAQKCPERANEFIDIPANKAKRLGSKVSIRADWDDVKLRVMWDLVHQKFKDENLLRQLKAIDEPIVEHNWWHDNFWGACICEECKNKEKHNWLGRILEDIKENS